MSREAIEGLGRMTVRRVPGHPRALVLDPPEFGYHACVPPEPSAETRNKWARFAKSFGLSRWEADLIAEARAELAARYFGRLLSSLWAS